MHVLILGAAGMIGRKLTARLVADGHVGGRAIERMTLADVVAPEPPAGGPGQVEVVAADLAEPGGAERLIEGRPDLIFHLAAVVSGEAEADFEKGYRVNLDGTRALLDAIRAAHVATGYHPRLVFTSSIAVYGAPLPNPIPEELPAHAAHQLRHPEGDRGAAAGRLHPPRVRRRHRDPAAHHLHPAGEAEPGRVRDSSRASSASRWSGRRRSCRFPRRSGTGTPHPARPWGSWSGRPRSTVRTIGPRRTLSMPGLSATVGEQIEALRRVAGEQAVRLIRREPDETIRRMVEGWAPALDATRALRLGFAAESSFDEIIRVHIEDELGGVRPMKVVVVGGGVLGVSTAQQLARSGAEVVLVTEGELVSQASGRSLSWLNSAGVRSEHYHRLRMAGIDRYRTLSATHPGLGWLRFDGGLAWPAEADELRRQHEHEQALGYDSHLLTAVQVAERVPGVDAAAVPPAGALWRPGEGWVDLPSLVRFLAEDFVEHGGRLVTEAGPARVVTADGRGRRRPDRAG